MKKLLAIVGLMFGWVGLSHAGIPVETYFMGQAPLSNASVIMSTFTCPGCSQTTISVSTAPGTVNNGGASISCRNCFTRFFVQMSTNVVLNILDGSTTNYAIQGI